MAEYDDTPAAMVRTARDRSRPSLGDPAAMATRIIESVDVSPAPRRLVLGSDSDQFIRTALTERLADIDEQADTAGNTDDVAF